MFLHILLCLVAWPALSTGLRDRARITLHKHHSQHQDTNYAPVKLNPSSKHNHESQSNRQACDFERDNIGMTHAAIPTEWWFSYNEDERLLTNWTRRYKEYMAAVPEYSDTNSSKAHGRGIVFASGPANFNTMLVAIRMMRSMGCKLPMEVWHFEGELRSYHIGTLQRLSVAARSVGDPDNYVKLKLDGFMAKPYLIKVAALLNSAFEDILFLDADNVATRDPTYLFDTQEYKDTGAMFFPDFWHIDARNPIFKIFDLPCFVEPEFESGQFLINKRLHWKALQLTWFMNAEHAFFYRLLFGDKDTFKFALRATNEPYHFIRFPPAEVGFVTGAEKQICGHTLGHRDPQGNIVFLHAHLLKWHDWKGIYQFTVFKDGTNNFNAMRPWTVAQVVGLEDAQKVRPQWFTAWQELRCLQYVHKRTGDHTVVQRMDDGKKVGPADKDLIPDESFDRFVDAAFWDHFDKAEGPLLMVSPY